MAYSKFLKKAIKESNKSLRQIEIECKNNYNINVSHSYLSVLQNGGQTPASDEVNIAIAKVCKINPDDLLFEAALERSPELVKGAINQMLSIVKGFLISMKNIGDVENKEIKEQANKFLNMSDGQFMNEISKIDYKSLQEYKVPIEDKNDDQNEKAIKNMFLEFNIGITMLDNSMFPIISQGAKIELDNVKQIENGDVIVAFLNDKDYVIRTYVKNGKTITLIPANKSFETITCKESEINIKGKVKSITTEL